MSSQDSLELSGSGHGAGEFKVWAKMSINNVLKDAREIKASVKEHSAETTRKITAFHDRQNILERDNATLKQKVVELEKENDGLKKKLEDPAAGIVAIKTRQDGIVKFGTMIGGAAMSGIVSILIWLWVKNPG